MGKIDLNDKLSIINFGVDTQHRLANLNEVVSSVVKDKDYSDIKGLYDTMTELMSMDGDKTPFYTESVLNGIKEELLETRIDLLKECKLYEELRKTNQLYMTELSEEISGAEAFISETTMLKKILTNSMGVSQLKSRIQEMKTTRMVAETLNNQLALYQKNSASLAERVGSVTHTLMPLWESGVALSVNKKSTQKASKMLKALLEEAIRKI